MKKNSPENSRPLDIWIWSNKPEIRKTADYIFTQLRKKHALQLKNGFNFNRLKNHLKVILTDLYVIHKEDPQKYLAFSRDNSKYSSTKRYKNIFLKPRYMAFLSDFLATEGFIEFYKGIHFGNYSRISRMKATPKLLRHFRKNRVQGQGVILTRKPGIILKDEEKRIVDFDTDTLEVKTLLRNIWKINKHLKTYEISLDTSKISKEDLAEYKSVISGKYSKYIRIFNNSSFNEGGRFYCHWTQLIPRDFRKHILINGRDTVELDYACLHITLLYALEGIEPPRRDLYKLYGISDEYRDIIKKSFNIVINSEDESSAIKAINEERRKIKQEDDIICPKADDILFWLKIAHPALIKYFCTGYGIYLQRIDSDLAESIMLELFSQGICVLCIHDSYIVNTEYESVLYKSMIYNFYNRFNFFPNIK